MFLTAEFPFPVWAWGDGGLCIWYKTGWETCVTSRNAVNYETAIVGEDVVTDTPLEI